jgi:hypothetical protein
MGVGDDAGQHASKYDAAAALFVRVQEVRCLDREETDDDRSDERNEIEGQLEPVPGEKTGNERENHD